MTARSSDNATLDMIRARASGESSDSIAIRLGLSPEAVRVATNRVKTADIRESGEDREAVLRSYWGR